MSTVSMSSVDTLVPIHVLNAFSIRDKRVKNIHKLGKGSYGVVIGFKSAICCDRHYDKDAKRSDGYCLKRIAIKIIESVKKDTTKIEPNKTLLTNLNHKNIAKFYDVFLDSNESVVYILMRKYNMTAFEYFAHYKSFDQSKELMSVAKDFTHQMISALNYIHNIPNCFIHGDINLQNILVNVYHKKHANYVLNDFGLAQYIRNENKEKTELLTPCLLYSTEHRPPCLFYINRKHYIKSEYDFFALFICMYFLCNNYTYIINNTPGVSHLEIIDTYKNYFKKELVPFLNRLNDVNLQSIFKETYISCLSGEI